jgi:hypothetical protein
LVAPELDDALIEMGCPGGCGPFHAECLQNWLYQQRTCPLCRYALPRANRQSQPTRWEVASPPTTWPVMSPAVQALVPGRVETAWFAFGADVHPALVHPCTQLTLPLLHDALRRTGHAMRPGVVLAQSVGGPVKNPPNMSYMS